MAYLFLPIYVSLLLWASFTASTDAQGALVFILVLPLCYWMARVSEKHAAKRRSRIPRLIAAGMKYFLGIYLITLFLPMPFNVPNQMIHQVAEIYKARTGESPYQWARRRNDIYAMLEKQIELSQGGEIDFSKIDPMNDWDRVCFLDPEMDDVTASRVTQSEKFKLSPFTSDLKNRRTVLLFMDDDQMAYIAQYPVAKYDFTKLIGTCIKRKDSPN
jgi:hypothetical protein